MTPMITQCDDGTGLKPHRPKPVQILLVHDGLHFTGEADLLQRCDRCGCDTVRLPASEAERHRNKVNSCVLVEPTGKTRALHEGDWLKALAASRKAVRA